MIEISRVETDKIQDEVRCRTIADQLESLKSEYNAYHIDKDDYWRGVEHSIRVLENTEVAYGK